MCVWAQNLMLLLRTAKPCIGILSRDNQWIVKGIIIPKSQEEKSSWLSPTSSIHFRHFPFSVSPIPFSVSHFPSFAQCITQLGMALPQFRAVCYTTGDGTAPVVFSVHKWGWHILNFVRCVTQLGKCKTEKGKLDNCILYNRQLYKIKKPSSLVS